MTNFQIFDRVTIARPAFGHECYANQCGAILRAYKALRSEAKSYAVSLPCPKMGAQVVIFSEKELELAPEVDAEAQNVAPAVSVSAEVRSVRSGGAMQCQRCGAPAGNLPGISRCLEWVDGRRCGGAMETI